MGRKTQQEIKAGICKNLGTSLEVQWLRLCASKAQAAGSIPVVWPKKKKQNRNILINLRILPLTICLL